MATEHNPPLTSAEIGSLWNQYMIDTMSLQVEKVHAAKEQDEQARAIMQAAVSLMETTSRQIRQILQNEGIPLPQGFTDEDAKLVAPPLYSGIFRLQYIKFKANLRMTANGLALAEASRADIRSFYRDLTIATLAFDDKTTNLLLEKGLYIRAPYISVGERAEYVQGQNFMGNFFGGGERKLLAKEITPLFFNIQSNLMGKTLLTGFCQVVELPDIREYMRRGVEIAKKHIEVFSSLLREEDIPIPMPSDSGVTNSTIAPFSDKLMLFHVALLNQAGIAAYGIALSTSERKDLQADYVRLMAEIGQYAADGANLLIEHNWMEEPPEAVDHRELAYRQ